MLLFVLGWIAIMAGLVAELVMRSGFEYNAGRYWEETKRVNLASPDGDILSRASVPEVELAARD